MVHKETGIGVGPLLVGPNHDNPPDGFLEARELVDVLLVHTDLGLALNQN